MTLTVSWVWLATADWPCVEGFAPTASVRLSTAISLWEAEAGAAETASAATTARDGVRGL